MDTDESFLKSKHHCEAIQNTNLQRLPLHKLRRGTFTGKAPPQVLTPPVYQETKRARQKRKRARQKFWGRLRSIAKEQPLWRIRVELDRSCFASHLVHRKNREYTTTGPPKQSRQWHYPIKRIKHEELVKTSHKQGILGPIKYSETTARNERNRI